MKKPYEEYVREAVRKHMAWKAFETTSKKVSKRLRKKGLSPKDVEAAVEEVRSRH